MPEHIERSTAFNGLRVRWDKEQLTLEYEHVGPDGEAQIEPIAEGEKAREVISALSLEASNWTPPAKPEKDSPLPPAGKAAR